ncbi:hypothetical protein HPB47_025585 [Ixodes persulcatus]|uniref:Uncharacterized protein n=1 Tax=Ixodes persulcatus TaxID=34615 RepID=A0AC60Q2X8_IXOPE|nr:hypothetical protein HPB47_025585 [Ixodes persulcatus]
MPSAMGPFVSLLEECLEKETIRRDVVAERLVAALSHIGRLFAMLTPKCQDCVIARVSPDLHHIVAHDCGYEGSTKLFGGSFLEKLKTRNETLKVLGKPGNPLPG